MFNKNEPALRYFQSYRRQMDDPKGLATANVVVHLFATAWPKNP